MRILLDGRIVLPRMTGAGRYVFEIARRLPGLRSDIELDVLLRPTLMGTDVARSLGESGAGVCFCDARVASLRQWFVIPRLVRRMRPDVYHYPFLDLPYVHCPSVVTIYDLNPVLDSAYFGRWAAVKRPLAGRLLRSSLRRCRVAVTISEATRRLLEDGFADARGKTRTIPLAPSFPVSVSGSGSVLAMSDGDRQGAERWSGRPYVLYVGVDRPHKNLVRLVRGFAAFRKDEGWATGLGPYLWLAGVGDGSSALRAELRDSPAASDVRLSGALTEERVEAAYRGASMVAYVSTSEGFGLPILEGFAFGCPVLTSGLSSMPEVGGEAALYVSPEDAQDIASGLGRLWRDDALKRRLVALGTRRLGEFSWDTAARKTLAAYSEALRPALP